MGPSPTTSYCIAASLPPLIRSRHFLCHVSNPLKWWYEEKSCCGLRLVHPDIGIDKWRLPGTYNRKSRYYFKVTERCPEDALRIQCDFETTLVAYYELLEQGVFESTKPGRTKRLDRQLVSELLPVARQLAK